MNWQEVINQFHSVNANDLPDFASARDKEQAVHLYNKAVEHISHDSADIALIALRRLASSYPKFGQASFLAACLLADDEQYQDAQQLLEQALNQGFLEESDYERAETCQAYLTRLMTSAGVDTDSAKQPLRNARPALDTAAVLEKIKRRGKVTMASERERQDVIRQGEAGEQETLVENRRHPTEYLRLGLPVLIGLLLVGFLIFAGIRWLPRLGRDQDDAAATAQKLEWLLIRLEELAEDHQNIDQLLDAYNRTFTEPEPTPEPAQTTAAQQTTASEPVETTAESTTAEATTTVSELESTPTTQPTEDPNINLLDQAEDSYLSAQSLLDQDVMAAADQLFMAQSILEAIPGATENPDTGLRAEQLYEDVMDQLDDIALIAANRFREAGRRLFDQGEYEQALVPYLKGFALDPGNYRGGLAYYCGRSYQLLDRYEEAKPYFEYVIEHFANREIAGYSANRLREMGF